MLEYGTTQFLSHQNNSALVEAWDTFNVSAEKIIRERFCKTKLPPLILTNLITNTQACAASIQLSFGSKAEEINNI